MADDLAEVRARIDLVELVSKQVALKRSGRNYVGLCPFHDDSKPSFSVSPTLQRYRCWACGESGDAFTWVMKTQRLDFPEALRILAESVGVKLSRRADVPKEDLTDHRSIMRLAQEFFRTQFELSKEAAAYCENRGLDKESLFRWEIGFSPGGGALANHLQRKGVKLAQARELFLVDEDDSGGYFDRFRGRLMFPIRDERGELVAFGGRAMGDVHPKYINSSDTPLYRKSKVLYGFHLARDAVSKGNEAVLVEGYMDTIACHRAGVTNAVASLGTALADDQVRLLRRWCRKVVILYDADEAGAKAAIRAAELLQAAEIEVKVAVMREGDDPDTLLKARGPSGVKAVVEAGISPIDFELAHLESQLAPTQEGFWREAVRVMSKQSNAMELDRLIVRLATRYPGHSDQIAAQRALRTEVAKHRRIYRSSAPSTQPAAKKRGALPLSVEERGLFRGLLRQSFMAQAWKAIREEGLCYTPEGLALRSAMVGAFDETGPTGEPAEWIAEIADDDAVSLLVDLSFMERPFLSESYLEDCAAKLRSAKERRERLAMAQEGLNDADDAKLRELQERLRRRAGN